METLTRSSQKLGWKAVKKSHLCPKKLITFYMRDDKYEQKWKAYDRRRWKLETTVCKVQSVQSESSICSVRSFHQYHHCHFFHSLILSIFYSLMIVLYVPAFPFLSHLFDCCPCNCCSLPSLLFCLGSQWQKFLLLLLQKSSVCLYRKQIIRLNNKGERRKKRLVFHTSF